MALLHTILTKLQDNKFTVHVLTHSLVHHRPVLSPNLEAALTKIKVLPQ
jgi:hypothetical protein